MWTVSSIVLLKLTFSSRPKFTISDLHLFFCVNLQKLCAKIYIFHRTKILQNLKSLIHCKTFQNHDLQFLKLLIFCCCRLSRCHSQLQAVIDDIRAVALTLGDEKPRHFIESIKNLILLYQR